MYPHAINVANGIFLTIDRDSILRDFAHLLILTISSSVSLSRKSSDEILGNPLTLEFYISKEEPIVRIIPFFKSEILTS